MQKGYSGKSREEFEQIVELCSYQATAEVSRKTSRRAWRIEGGGKDDAFDGEDEDIDDVAKKDEDVARLG